MNRFPLVAASAIMFFLFVVAVVSMSGCDDITVIAHERSDHESCLAECDKPGTSRIPSLFAQCVEICDLEEALRQHAETELQLRLDLAECRKLSHDDE